MARLEEREYTYFTTVRSVCATCRTSVPARVFFRAGGVWQQSLCPRCVAGPVMIAGGQDWFLRQTIREFPQCAPMPQARLPEKGCPFDCGPCTWHASACESLEITANSEEDAREAVERALGAAGSEARVCVRTEARHALAVARACRRAGVRRLLLRAHGLEPSAELAELEPEVVLSCNDECAVSSLSAAGLRIHLEAPLAEVGGALRLMRGNRNIVALSVISRDVPVDNAAKYICAHSRGDISFSDFEPTTAHPLCTLRCAFGQPARPVTVHAIMAREAFDCFRALLCPHWALLGGGVLAPACTAGFLYGEN